MLLEHPVNLCNRRLPLIVLFVRLPWFMAPTILENSNGRKKNRKKESRK